MLNEVNGARFCAVRRAVIAREFEKLNPEQREGVLTTEGPLLLLAGAGSGKTTVLINRIANLIRFGCGSDSTEVPAYLTEDDIAFLEDFLKTPSEASRMRMERLLSLIHIFLSYICRTGNRYFAFLCACAIFLQDITQESCKSTNRLLTINRPVFVFHFASRSSISW